MADYIDRELAVKKIYANILQFDTGLDADYSVQLLFCVPPADVVEVRQGEWVEGQTLEKCSLCGKKGFPEWRYCPNCGAKMDGKGE